MQLTIINIPAQGLVDTGAYVSCVSRTFVQKLGLSQQITALGQKVLSTADGKPLHIIGEIELSLKFRDLIIPFTFTVLQTLTMNLILGLDFLKHTGSKIDLSGGMISLYDDLVIQKLIRPSEILARNYQSLTIPPKSEALVTISVPSYLHDKLLLIKPAASLHNTNLVLARVIIMTRNNRSVCQLLNPT